MTKITYIPGEIANAAIDEHGNRKPVTRTHHIFDDTLGKPQSEVNQDRIEDVAAEVQRAQGAESTLDGKIGAEKTRAEGVEGGLNTRLQTVEELAEISISGGEAQIATGADFTNPDATKRAKVPTVGAIVDGLNDGIYDVSKRNPTAGPNSDGKFTLDYILSNADTLIPTGWRHGGMTISFVHTSDNKYVQYRLTADEWSTDTDEWALCSEDVLIENPEFVKVVTDKEGKILYAVKTDGDFVFGVGVPQQIIDYVTSQISVSEEELITLITTKVDKVEGKSLVDSEYANGVSYIENPEFISVKTDSENKILWAIKKDGSIYYGAGVPQQVIDYIEEKLADLSLDEYEDIVAFLSDYLGSDTTLKAIIDGINGRIPEAIENPEYIQMTTDSDDKILEGITSEGVKKINLPVNLNGVLSDNIKRSVDWTKEKTVGTLNFDYDALASESSAPYGLNSYEVNIPAHTKFWIRVSEQLPSSVVYCYIVFYKKDMEIGRERIIYYESCTSSFEYEQDITKIEIYSNQHFPNDFHCEVSIQMLEMLTNDYKPELYVPSYYFNNNYLQNKVARIKALIKKCAGNGDAFIFSTDEHWERNAKNSVSLMTYIQDKVNIAKTFSGGDTGHHLPAFEMVELRKKLLRGKQYYAVGNHEYLVTTTEHTYDAGDLDNLIHYAFNMYNDEQVGNSKRNYFYVDNKRQKTRYVILNAYRQGPEQVVGGYYMISAINAYMPTEQEPWLTQEALEVPSDWKILVFIHVFYFPKNTEGTVVSEEGIVIFPELGKLFLEHNLTDKGKIIGILCGHVHRDATAQLNSDLLGLTEEEYIEGNIPIIVTTCDARCFDDIPSEVLEGRELGTTHEQAFDVVIADYTNKTITAVRIGAPAGIDFQQPGSLEERTISFE